MATKITTSRQFRRGRVLHGLAADFVLVHSPGPRKWQGILLPVEGGSVQYRTYSSEFLKSIFSEYSTGVRTPRTSADSEVLISVATREFGADSLKSPWVIRSALVRRAYDVTVGPKVGGATSPLKPGIPMPAPIEGAFKEPLYEPAGTEKAPEKAEKKATVTSSRVSSFSTPALVERPYWYEADNDRKLMRDYISLREAGFTVNLMIAGPSGAGKTVGVQRLGEELGIPVHIVNCQAVTTPEKWLGQMMADPVKGTYFEPSVHIQWVERTHEDCKGAERCILLYDEITRLRPDLNNMTYSLFDTQRGLEVPQMGRRVHMDPNNLIVATANIGAAFAGTFGQDRAFRERFSMTMERDFPPRDEEVKILTSATNISKADAETLVKVAEHSRRRWKEQSIEQPISTRTLVTWALLVAGGYDIKQAAEYTVLPLYSEDGGLESDRTKIRAAIDGKAA